MARPVDFSHDGWTVVYDHPARIQAAEENQERVRTGKYIQKFRPYSGNQAIYDAGERQNKTFAANGKPRGYSKDYWNTINRGNSKRGK